MTGIARRVRVAAVGLAACLALAAAASCSSGDVILATIPASDDSGSSEPLRCGSISDCPSGEYCGKVACGDTTGTCELYPAECANLVHRAVCGCDGITYFDDCLRQASGTESSTEGPCWLGSARTCGGASGGTCPQGATCAHLGGFGPGTCDPSTEGTCWVIPATCPPPSQSYDEWVSCQGGFQAPCVDTCNAILDGGAYHRAQQCH
jgi:hypothetical protein